MVGVGVGKERGEDDLGLVLANDAGHEVAGFDPVLEEPVGKIEQPPPHAEDLRGAGCFFGPCLGVAVGRGLTVGHVQQENVVPLAGQLGDGAAHAELLIIGMGAHNEDIHSDKRLAIRGRRPPEGSRRESVIAPEYTIGTKLMAFLRSPNR